MHLTWMHLAHGRPGGDDTRRGFLSRGFLFRRLAGNRIANRCLHCLCIPSSTAKFVSFLDRGELWVVFAVALVGVVVVLVDRFSLRLRSLQTKQPSVFLVNSMPVSEFFTQGRLPISQAVHHLSCARVWEHSRSPLLLTSTLWLRRRAERRTAMIKVQKHSYAVNKKHSVNGVGLTRE